MENYLYGRLTTLNYLKARRDDASKHPFRRLQADRALRKIVAQLRDRELMKLRERLIRANLYEDAHAVFMIGNQIRAYEGRYGEIEDREYTARDEDDV